MRIRRKTKRRAVMLLVAAGVLITTAAAAYKLRTSHIEREATQSLHTGLASLEQHDYFEAMHAIGRYVNRHPRDAEALYAYARARQRVGEPYAAHLTEAMGVLRRVLSLAPGHIEARRDLLDLYERLGFGPETLESADALLAQAPDDPQALRCRTIALVRLQRLDEAKQAAETYTRLHPLDVQGRLRLFAIMRKQGSRSDQVIEAARNLHESDPNERRYDLLMAFAHHDAGDRDEALKWAKQAMVDAPSDPEFVTHLVGLLDQMEQFDLSQHVLESLATTGDDPKILRQLIRRLWESGQWGDVVQTLRGLDDDSPVTDAELLALKALALMKLDRAQEALPIVAALQSRRGDSEADAWASLLSVRFEPAGARSDVIGLCRQALARVPDHPYFQFMLGDALAAAGELDLALDAWVRSAREAPAWALPMIRAAEAYLQTGRPREAFAAARTAVKRAPRNIDAAIVLAQAWHANLPPGASEPSRELAMLVDEIQRASPREPKTLPIRVALHVRHDGVDAAADELRAILQQDEPPAPDTLLRLAQVSDEQELGLREQVLAKYEQKYGLTPALAYTRAASIAQNDGPEPALAYLDRASAEGKGEPLAWRLARARLLEHVNDPRAGTQWMQLVEQQPQNRQVLQMALESRHVWRNRTFVEKAIERLGEISGERSPVYVEAKARWLLMHDGTDRGAAEATTMLNRLVRMSPTLVEPRVMLAQCLRRLGHDSAAMKHLAVAVEQRPQSLPIVYQFADLAQRRGDYDAAREALKNAVNDQTEAGARRRTAELLARQGDVAEAIAVLEAAPRQDADEPDLLLARLHRQDGNRERTLQMCARLMSSPTLPHIAFAADTYASYGMMEEAEGALAKLDDLELDADRKHLVRAVFAERYGTEESARRELQSAVETGPQSAVNWAAWVRFLLQRGEADAAKTAIAEAHAQLPKAPAFTFLSRHADVLDVVAAIPISRVVAISLVDDPAHRNTGVEALSILKRSSSADALTDADMLELRRLADENPRYLPLSSLVVRLYLAMSRHDEAVALATRGVNLSRHDVEPAWLAAEAAAAAGQWNRALFLAREWRRRSRGQSMMADVAIAQAHVQLQEADHALRQLDPYLDELADAPTRHPAVLDQTVRTLIAAGKADEAEARLSPLLSQDARWRKLWIDLAVLAIEDEQTGAHWLMRVEQYLPAEARDERLMLAQGWYYLSRKAKQPDYDAAARRLLEQITQGEQASAEALVLLGVMRHAGGDEAAAEQLYRRAIAADDRVALAHNNLAALLAERPGQAQAALEAARAAVRLDPANAEYQQTLAGVLSARGDHAAAAEALRQAVKIDPYEPRWQAALIEALSASGDHEEARRATDRFDARFDSSRLPEPMQKQLESLRRSLGIGGAAAGASADGGRLK